MIGRLTGMIIEKQPPLLILDVHGVGYEVFAPMTTFYQLPDLQQVTTLLTHMVVREDAQLLYGFYSHQERNLFRALIKVNGVGPKLALTILSGIEPDEFVQSIHNNCSATLVKIPGIGKKTAERLIVEMRDVLNNWTITTTNTQHSNQQSVQDAISALTALGYKHNEACKMVEKIKPGDHSSEQLIRLALQNM